MQKMGNFLVKHNVSKPQQGTGGKKPKKQQEPTSFFERQKQEEYERVSASKVKDQVRISNGKRIKVTNERRSSSDSATLSKAPPVIKPPRPALDAKLSYDQEAIERMKHQLRADASAFLLNNIMLSVQFFDSYERVIWDLKNNSVTKSDVELNDQMAQHHKHVFLPDKLQEAVHEHVRVKVPPKDQPLGLIGARVPLEALQPLRMFVVYDNVEVNEPGEVSDYSTVLDAPYYRMLMEEDDEAGYVKLKKLEILENRASREESIKEMEKLNEKSQSSSGNESDSDESDKSKDEEVITEGRNFMNELKEKIDQPPKPAYKKPDKISFNDQGSTNIKPSTSKTPGKIETSEIISERRPSGILKQTNRAIIQGKLVHSETRPKKVKRQNNKKASPNGSESSGYKTSHSPQAESSGNESDYGYGKITAETTLKRLQKSETAQFSDSTSVIPARCITVLEIKKPPTDLSDEDDEIDEAYSTRYGSDFQRDLFKKMFYLNSSLFMRNFIDMFLLKLATSLGLSDSLNDALSQGASIYCNVQRGLKKSVSFEVLPALQTNWPNMAQGWVVRKRNVIRNPRTNFTYMWPTQYMVGKARGLNCLIIPLNFRSNKKNNKDQSLQWKLTFPAVERYLETNLAHSHVRCYLFATLLFKVFIKNENNKAGLDYSHIKNHLFWQCEDNYAKWPEDRLGETLKIFLKSFYHHLMKAKMPDYFVPQCNLLKTIPKPVLLKQQRILADILESPVMHLINALKNLKYVKSKFYPVLNYKKLYKILTCEDPLHMINPNLPRFETTQEDEESDSEQHEDQGFWSEIKHKGPGYKWRKEQFRQNEAKKAAETLYNNSKTTKEVIDKKIILPSHLDTHKRRLLLELFIPHFIAMAEWSENFDVTRQGIVYLEHAYRLSIMLRDEAGGEPDGKEFMAQIRDKIEKLKSKMAYNEAPRVPKRNESFNSASIRPGTSGLKKVEIQQEYVNLENVDSTDNNGVKEPMSPTVKMASLVLADVHVENDQPKFFRAVSFQRVDEESENESDETENVTESKL